MRRYVQPGGELAGDWDPDFGGPRPGLEPAERIVARWRVLASRGPVSLPRDLVRAGTALVRQWDVRDPNRPPPPYLRVVLALGDVALDFAQASPGLLAQTGAGKPLLDAVAAVASETRAILPSLEDPEAWKGDKWIGASFAQSLLATAFRAGLATLADHPEIVVKKEHMQRLITGALLPLKQGFDAQANRPGATSAAVFAALFEWEALRDDVLPGMVVGTIRAVAVDRNAFLGSLVRPGDGSPLPDLVAAVSDAVLDQASKLTQGDQLQRQTWLDFFRAAVSVIASRPELVVTGSTTDQKAQALRGLVGAVAAKVAADAQVGTVGQAVLVDAATAALDSVRTSLPLLLGPAGTWDGVAAGLAGAVVDALRPALAGQDPALLKRLAGRDAVAELVTVVVRQVAATPALAAGGKSGDEVKAVVAAIAGAMVVPGADLLHPAAWLAVAAAAAKAAAANPGRLFSLAGPDTAVGGSLIAAALRQAAALGTAGPGGLPVVAGPVLQDVLVGLLLLASRRRILPPQVAAIGGLLATLAAEAARPDGRLLPGELADGVPAAALGLLDGTIAADADINAILAALGRAA